MEESVIKRIRNRSSKSPKCDRLSELPISLIHLILSFLPIRDVIATTILSKRWKNLWTTVPCLNFCELSEHYDCEAENIRAENIRSFVNRALMFWRRVGNLKLKFDFIWDFDEKFASDIDLWVRFAVENDLKVLNISLMCEELGVKLEPVEMEGYAYCVPLCLYSCSSIKELSLVGCSLQFLEQPSWDQLTSLKIDGYCFSECVISSVLLGSPRLEVFELRLVECDEDLSIRSTSLKKLKVEMFMMRENVTKWDDTVVKICCPNLEMLAISGVLRCRYLFTDVSCVSDVILGFNGSHDYAYGNELLEDTLKLIFETFRRVRKVTLSYWCIQVLGMLQSLPKVEFFPNVKTLVVKNQTRSPNDDFDAGRRKRFGSNLFDASKYLKFETKLSKSFMLQLKAVDITLLSRKTSTYRFIEFLLRDACMLEKLVIRVSMYRDVGWFEVAKELLSMPRSSPTLKVILEKC